VTVKIRTSLGLVVVAALVVPSMIVLHAQGRSREDQRRRNILVMEGVLVQAVRLGAQEVSSTMEKFDPAGVTALTGTPRARGFVLDGYGIFFDVEIPNLNQGLVWSMLTVQRDRQVERELALLRAALDGLPEGPGRQQAQQALQQVRQSVGPPVPTRAGVVQDAPPPGQVAASNVAVPMPDPDSLYTEAVKGALVDAMLDHSLQMNLGPDEWLTVAARASDGPLSPNGLSDSVTIILRVKGSDLSVYHSDKSKRDEILDKVKVEAKVF
jgi:hypothetical protein